MIIISSACGHGEGWSILGSSWGGLQGQDCMGTGGIRAMAAATTARHKGGRQSSMQAQGCKAHSRPQRVAAWLGQWRQVAGDKHGDMHCSLTVGCMALTCLCGHSDSGGAYSCARSGNTNRSHAPSQLPSQEPPHPKIRSPYCILLRFLIAMSPSPP